MYKETILSILAVFLLPAFAITGKSQQNNFNCGDIFTDDRDGKTYGTVMIGNQCWFSENLNTGVQVNDLQQTNNQIIEKTCYENQRVNCDQFGGLYTWHQAMNWDASSGDICPAGWKVPSKEEWDALRMYLGYEHAGQKLKATRDHTPSWDGTNESGFTALPAGVGYEGFFGRRGHWSIYWTSTQVDANYAWFAQLDNFWYPASPKYKILFLGDHFVKENGFSIRCIKKD